MSEAIMNHPGTFAWNEIATSNPQESIAFYTGLLGWTAEEMPGGGYYMLKNGDEEIAGLMDKSENCDGPPLWISYVTVENLEASVAKATELGGKAVVGITPVEGRGRFALLEDPQGGKFALWQYNT